ncbi:hypothetical protein HMPREF1565_1152 [Providencia alcalifaciens RIMD 1656011]|uniref:Uncharacterized protein n=1 Tax=Providencia alcalifaciens DSM 30120 TaxID=520999 RepID=B6XD65_9GAMM|nr:hypothetical protein CO695_02485 [Providencia alcalifaciens]EEB46563.1 hypothetical protein PROVALCAL_01287 [Providencia alcalifaciens DSM 30120]ETT06638.1 hypothetical protein HMPREF1562_4186 [Providencia alcalifaciens F90-2004]EUD05186.1 hypothetical protein HMPREF1565_1152 [Providencia alcalifaciens RIMD 1656011]
MARNYSGHIIIDIYFDKTYVEKKKNTIFWWVLFGCFQSNDKIYLRLLTNCHFLKLSYEIYTKKPERLIKIS